MSWFDDFSPFNAMFGGNDYKNPANGANDYLNQIPDEMKKYLQPYIDQGNQLNPGLQSEYQKMMSDPGSIYGQLASGYQKSPGYDWRLNQGESAINNAQAAGGMVGSPQHQQQAGQLAQNMASGDFNNYMDRATGFFNQGLSGQQGISNRGFNASSSLADALANVLGGQGQYAYAGQAGANQASAQQRQMVMQILGMLAGAGGAGMF